MIIKMRSVLIHLMEIIFIWTAGDYCCHQQLTDSCSINKIKKFIHL